jgi:sporulation protein YlmC with PRC-barrel domain
MTFVHYTPRNMMQMLRPSPHSIVGAESVMGCVIVDRQGHRIGELRDIVLDLSTGRIAYAVIALQKCREDGQLVVVPWNVVHPDQGAQRLRVNAHADWIERAPCVQQGHAPDRFVQEWGALIHNYFGTRPYWEAAPTSQQYA